MKASIRRLLVLMILATWTASLCFQTLDIGFFSENGPPYGWTLLEWGWLGLLGGYFDWVANPVLIALLVCTWFGNLHRAIGLAMIGVLFLTVIANLARSEVLANEAGGMQLITQWYVGFYLWIASLTGAAIVGAASIYSQTNRTPRKERVQGET